MTLLGIYVDFGEDEGTYSTSDRRIKSLASELKPSLTSRGLESVCSSLRIHSPVVQRTIEAHLIPVGNGVFDHKRQTLRPFSADWIFLSKIETDYDPNAQSPIFTMPDGVEWTFDGWLLSLSDDPGVPELLWEVISASARSYEPWNKALWLVSERGNNGKGTFVQFIRNLLGKKLCSAVQFADFGHEFKMEPLLHSRVNLVDENGVGTFADRIDAWKAFITGDTITLNRKHKTPIAVSWRGIDIQCLNSFSQRTKDRSESFYRRLLIIPFRKWFGDGERKYIKRDYLEDPQVLRYALKRALEMQHTEFSNPAVCREALDEYKGTNNGLLSFWLEFENQFPWDLLPFRFLYDLYCEWFRRVNPSGQIESMNALVSFLKEHLAGSEEWEHKGSVAVRPKLMMSQPEPLIVEYNLTDWMNSTYSGTDPNKKTLPYPLKTNYKGLVRRQPISASARITASTVTEP
ncbi:DNA primase family protein [Leifsonia sp. P73]|uniref:DNA primase family protein n=1 Tax=Leifsonia sp. P73 TaxID=3423959 RepID=UPI003DA47118